MRRFDSDCLNSGVATCELFDGEVARDAGVGKHAGDAELELAHLVSEFEADGGGDGFVELVAASIGDDSVETCDGARTCVNRFEG